MRHCSLEWIHLNQITGVVCVFRIKCEPVWMKENIICTVSVSAPFYSFTFSNCNLCLMENLCLRRKLSLLQAAAPVARLNTDCWDVSEQCFEDCDVSLLWLHSSVSLTFCRWCSFLCLFSHRVTAHVKHPAIRLFIPNMPLVTFTNYVKYGNTFYDTHVYNVLKNILTVWDTLCL